MGYYNERPSFLSNIPPATRALLVINIIFYLATFVADMRGTDVIYEYFAVFFPTSPFFRPWQILTYMFVHGNFAHLFFNMWGLVMFGMALERAIGTKKFLILYFAAGIGAYLLHTGVQWAQYAYYLSAGSDAATQAAMNLLRTPTLGASGAIYGIEGAFAVVYPNLLLTLLFPPVSLKAKWMILIFIGIELITGITGTMDGIAHFAHLGGALVGFLLMLYWKKRNRW